MWLTILYCLPCLSESELGNAELLKFCNNETSEIQEVQKKQNKTKKPFEIV